MKHDTFGGMIDLKLLMILSFVIVFTRYACNPSKLNRVINTGIKPAFLILQGWMKVEHKLSIVWFLYKNK